MSLGMFDYSDCFLFIGEVGVSGNVSTALIEAL